MTEAPHIGIDLGTTHSVVAVFDGEARVLPGPDGTTLLPSVVAFDDADRLLVGAAARERAAHHPASACERFKPMMGDGAEHALAGHRLSTVALSALVLRELRERASASLGAPVHRAVITVPAWFGEPARRATLEAAQLAGLEVQQLINEPTAAALAYGLRAAAEPEAIAVLDLGGGTFDVTLLEAFDGVIDVRASVGDVHLGGEDFTDALLSLLPDEGAAPARRRRAEIAKRQLATATVVEVPLADGRVHPVSREDFELAAAALLGRLRRCVLTALVQGGLRAESFDRVLLVGGAVRLPAVQALAASLFGRPVELAPDVDHIVARGAALHAALLSRHEALREHVVTDVLTHTLGIDITTERDGTTFDNRFAPLLLRGTALPASHGERFWTRHPQQHTVELNVFEGEHREATRNHRIGRVVINGLPTSDDPEHRVPIDVRFTHDTNGLLRVDARDATSGHHVSVILERTARPLSPDQAAAARAALEALARSPRDEEPNRLLIERAAALLALLRRDERRALDELLLSFEAALERRDRSAIAQVGHALRHQCDEIAGRHGVDLLDLT